MVFLVSLLVEARPKALDGVMTQWCGVARDEADARAIAASVCCDEGPAIWSDPMRSKVESIDPNIRRTIMTDAGDYATDGY